VDAPCPVDGVGRDSPRRPADGDADTVDGGDWPNGVERPRPPRGDLGVPVGGDRGDERRGDRAAVALRDDVPAVAGGHPVGGEGQDRLVDVADAARVLGDAFRLDGAVAVTGGSRGIGPSVPRTVVVAVPLRRLEARSAELGPSAVGGCWWAFRW
jgi:hypothetical protein